MATRAKKPAKTAATNGRLIPPKGGAAVRMYRIGHGDCFLIAFDGQANDPAYVLIDCGYKPGSPQFINTTSKEIAADILAATGGHVDVAVLTHEHQDHLNAITKTNFDDLEIGETWCAWTEDPDDDLANDLRKRFKDKLLGLVAARNRLSAAGDAKRVERLDDLLAFELGGDDPLFDATAAGALLATAAADSKNKQAMKLFKDKAKKGVKFIRPHQRILRIPKADGVRVFALGPPHDTDLLATLDPTGDEEFGLARVTRSAIGHFAAAVLAAEGKAPPDVPFASRYAAPWDPALEGDEPDSPFFSAYYGKEGDPPASPPSSANVESVPEVTNPEWRRIDKDWLYASDQLALDMNDQTNNSSLVLAFEIGEEGKVLLFAADAQRGNWLSWSKKEFADGNKTVTAKSLLSRTVLYKVGHHGSHNGTLNGRAADGYTNLSWMAEGDHAREFCAMITAVRAWAETQKGWDHPLKAIKDALLKKSGGRVFQTDTDVSKMAMVNGGSAVEWKSFQERTTGTRLYFDYRIEGS